MEVILMKESFLIIKRIESDLKEIVKQTETKIMKSIPSLPSYDLRTSRKYYISHDYDPPWDHSGNLFTSLSGNVSQKRYYRL